MAEADVIGRRARGGGGRHLTCSPLFWVRSCWTARYESKLMEVDSILAGPEVIIEENEEGDAVFGTEAEAAGGGDGKAAGKEKGKGKEKRKGKGNKGGSEQDGAEAETASPSPSKLTAGVKPVQPGVLTSGCVES